MLCNILDMFCNVLGMLGNIKELVVHYSFASKLIRQKVGGFLFDVGRQGRCKAYRGRPRTLQSMPRTLQNMPRSAEDIAKHALGTHNKRK